MRTYIDKAWPPASVSRQPARMRDKAVARVAAHPADADDERAKFDLYRLIPVAVLLAWLGLDAFVTRLPV